MTEAWARQGEPARYPDPRNSSWANRSMHFLKFERRVLECVDAARGMPRHCAKHALLHLDRAWKLKKRDPEMAVFRAITAEEEAATAIFASLLQLGYSRAKKLNFRKHTHKQALYPFLQAVASFLAETQHSLPPLRRRITKRGNRKVLLIDLVFDGAIGTPEPPLNLTVRDLPSRDLVSFTRHIEQVAGVQGSTKVRKFLEQRASFRNQLLYADASGIPRVDGETDRYVRSAKDRVLNLLQIFCLIFPYRTRAPFVQQTMDAFLLMLGRVDKDEIKW